MLVLPVLLLLSDTLYDFLLSNKQRYGPWCNGNNIYSEPTLYDKNRQLVTDIEIVKALRIFSPLIVRLKNPGPGVYVTFSSARLVPPDLQ